MPAVLVTERFRQQLYINVVFRSNFMLSRQLSLIGNHCEYLCHCLLSL